MTTLELTEVAEWLEARWGSQREWVKTDVLVEDFRQLTKGAVMEAAFQIYRTGTPHCPKPSVLLKEATERQASRWKSGTDPKPQLSCAEGHRWAHAPEWDALVCVRCESTQAHTPHLANGGCA